MKSMILLCTAALLSCGSPSSSKDAAKTTADPDAGSLEDAAPTARDIIVGVWQHTLNASPDYKLIWSLSPEGWGNVDSSGVSGTWCRNYISWTISNEVTPSQFTFSYTFEEPPCGSGSVGDTTAVQVIEKTNDNPLSLLTDWGGGAILRQCSAALDSTDPCQLGNDLGLPQQTP